MQHGKVKWTLSLHMIIPIKLLFANAFLEYLRDFNEVIFPQLNVPLKVNGQ